MKYFTYFQLRIYTIEDALTNNIITPLPKTLAFSFLFLLRTQKLNLNRPNGLINFLNSINMAHRCGRLEAQPLHAVENDAVMS